VEAGKIQLIVECSFEVDISRDSSDRPQLFGQGAWSKVYRALGIRKSLSSVCKSAAIPTPPPSPQTDVPLLVAVKSPVSKASRVILHNEAIILSHLTRTPYHDNFIVPFYGYIPSSASLVLAPVPLSLSDHITTRARLASVDHPDLSWVEPVLGSREWLSLAEKLVTALAWLHDFGGVIHGDIKPGNILLSPNRSSDDFSFDPLLIDFSSSHILSSTNTTPNTLSALTREYAAPELLSPSVLRDPSSTATGTSDVFSLAVTLIVAATGDLMVYSGNVLQRQYMATQGWDVLEFVRNGNSGTRVPSGGIVQTVVEGAVRKIDKGRIIAATWRELIRALKKEVG
jgi:serine/threonine protein kinase